MAWIVYFPRIRQFLIALLPLLFIITGCATIYYDETWIRPAHPPWPIPDILRVVVADYGTIANLCQKAGATIPNARGCYDPKTATLYAVPDWEISVHEFEHLFLGYWHP